MARHIAGRWGEEGIRCTGVAPGVVMTDAFKQSDSQDMKAWALRSIHAPRLGAPEDLAAVVAFLLSDDAAYGSGQVWSVCGGWSLRE